MQSVFCTSTRTPTEGSTAEISSTARMASKKVPPDAAILLWDFDAHQAESKKLRQQAISKVLLLVHLTDQRLDGLLREGADGIAEQNFVFSKMGKRRGSEFLSHCGHERQT